MILYILGERLFEIRRSLRLSRKKMAQLSTLSENTIKLWESGKVDPGFFKLTKYLQTFEKYDVHVSTKSLLRDNFSIKALAKHKQTTRLISDTTSEAARLFIGEKESMLQALLDTSSACIVFKDDKNNILRVNNRTAFETGGVTNDFEGKNLYDLFPFAEAEKAHQLDLEVLKSNKTLSTSYYVKDTITNTKNLVNVTKTPITVRDNKRIILVVWSFTKNTD